ncbi:hypothetical protein [Streptomyces nigrescens]|uniref:Uncharacterized protein n=1 Tax=Streptomyces nigrescens TaxID=1920 RepID=A0ABY7IU76_STRNI|nr:hypothetical protein [Streptomyces libani]WAU01504.1 hypothetical protein STRLI_007869 [Streptomyces libani subsp. libani]
MTTSLPVPTRFGYLLLDTADHHRIDTVGARSNAMVVVSAGRGVPKRRTDRLRERLVSRGFGGPPPGVR